MHQDTGQTSPGPTYLTEDSPSVGISRALPCAIASTESGKFGPAVGFHVPLWLSARGWNTQSKIIICITLKGSSIMAGVKPDTVQTRGRKHIMCSHEAAGRVSHAPVRAVPCIRAGRKSLPTNAVCLFQSLLPFL